MIKDLTRLLGEVPTEERLKQIALKPPKQPFPLHVIPESLRFLVESYEQTSGFSPEFQVGALLAIYAGCAGNRYKVQIKPGWTETPILWVPIVGDPSTLKTPVLKSYMRPIWKLEKQYQEEYEAALKKYEQEKADPHGPPEAELEMPQRREIIVANATMEAIFKSHTHNPNGLLMYRDELISWIKSMNQYRGKGDDEQNWLSIYSNEPLKISRATKETQMIPRACISVMGGIQPDMLSSIQKKGSEGNGFTYRMLFVYPSKKKHPGWLEGEVDPAHIAGYESALNRLITNSGNKEEYLMQLHPDAKELFIEWYNTNTKYINLVTDSARQGMYKKLEAQMLRIACVLQLMAWSYNKESREYISLTSLQGAIALAEYFRYTGLKSHKVIEQADPLQEKAADLYAQGFTIRAIAKEIKKSKTTVQKWKDADPLMFRRGREIEPDRIDFPRAQGG